MVKILKKHIENRHGEIIKTVQLRVYTKHIIFNITLVSQTYFIVFFAMSCNARKIAMGCPHKMRSLNRHGQGMISSACI